MIRLILTVLLLCLQTVLSGSLSVINLEPFRPIVPASTTKMDPKLAYQKAVLPVPKLHFVRPSKAGSGFYDSPQVQSFQGSPYFGGFFSIQPDSKTPTREQDPSYQFIPRQSPSQDEFGQSEPQAPSAQARSSETEDVDYQYENLEIDEYSRPVFKVYDAVPVQ